MQDQIGCWMIRGTITTVAGTPKTAVQYTASVTNTAEVLYFSCTQSSTSVSSMEELRVFRMTSPATGGTIGTVGGTTGNIFDLAAGASTFRGYLATSGTCVGPTASGTVGDNISQHNFNVLAGIERDLQPNMRIWIPVSGILALNITAVTTATYDVAMVVRESK